MSKEELIILSSLLNKDDKKLSYIILYILINISELKEAEKLFALDENICCNIACFLGNNKNENKLLFYGILLIRNITLDKNICEIFNKYKITQFFEEIYEKNLLSNKFMDVLTYILCSIINFEIKKPENKINISNLLPCIKIIATQLRPNYAASTLYKYIYKIYELCTIKDSDIYYKIINSKIHKELMNIYPIIFEKSEFIKQQLKETNLSEQQFSQEEISKYQEESDYYYSSCLLILKILGKLMSLDDGILTQTLLNANISSFLKPIILTNDIRTIKNACFCLSNICAGTYGQIAYLFHNNTLYELIKVSKNILEAMEYNKEKGDYYYQLKDTLREINYVFALTIHNGLFEKIVPFAKCDDYTPVMIIIKGLKIFCDINNQDLLDVILKTIYKLISFNNCLEDDICEIMEKFGLKENLENILLNKNWEVFEEAESLYDSIFGLI